MRRLAQIFLLLLFVLGCREALLRVDRIPEPAYPSRARFENVQGIVDVRVSIGTDGKVIYANGSGAPEVLVKAAEENARGWVYGPFPQVAEFPIDHTVRYVYVLEGKPVVAAVRPMVKTYLPDRVEIRAVPLVSDYPPLEQYRPVPSSK